MKRKPRHGQVMSTCPCPTCRTLKESIRTTCQCSSGISKLERTLRMHLRQCIWQVGLASHPYVCVIASYMTTPYISKQTDDDIDGAAMDGSPCTIGDDSNSTSENPWSMNNNVNMLYIDQPVGVGYSYDALIKSTQDLLFIGVPETSTGISPMEAYKAMFLPRTQRSDTACFHLKISTRLRTPLALQQ